MHVAFVVANYPPHVGGAEIHVANLAAQLVRNGMGVTVLALEARGERDASGIPVVGLGRHLEYGQVIAVPSMAAGLGLAGALGELGATHVSVHTRFFPATWLGVWAGHRAGLPVLLTEHGGGPVHSRSVITNTCAAGIDATMGTWSLRHADRLLAVSAAAAGFAQRLSGRRAVVCGHGIDLAAWEPPGVPQGEPRLVFVGRIVAEKGWRDFLEITRAAGPGVSASIAGAGPELELLRGQVAAMGLGAQLEVLGSVPQSRVAEILRGAVLVNPSTASEGMQTTLMEAAAAGARIATYDVGGAAEVRASGAVIEMAAVGDRASLAAAVERVLHASWHRPAGLAAFGWEAVAGIYVEQLESLGR